MFSVQVPFTGPLWILVWYLPVSVPEANATEDSASAAITVAAIASLFICFPSGRWRVKSSVLAVSAPSVLPARPGESEGLNPPRMPKLRVGVVFSPLAHNVCRVMLRPSAAKACSMQAGEALRYRDIAKRCFESLRIGFAPDVSNWFRVGHGVAATANSALRSHAPTAPESCARLRRVCRGASEAGGVGASLSSRHPIHPSLIIYCRETTEKQI